MEQVQEHGVRRLQMSYEEWLAMSDEFRSEWVDGEVLLMGDTPRSFDGRYFGPTPASDLIGRARLVSAARSACGKSPRA